jgi:hypothetical protein
MLLSGPENDSALDRCNYIPTRSDKVEVSKPPPARRRHFPTLKKGLTRNFDCISSLTSR